MDPKETMQENYHHQYLSSSNLTQRHGKRPKITTSDRSPEAIGQLLKRVGPPPIPKCAALGFHDYPFLVKVSSIGMFCSFIGKF